MKGFNFDRQIKGMLGNKRTSKFGFGKLKKDISKLANILVAGHYSRAAHFAHIKMTYKPESKDYYDENQWHDDYESSKGKKYRRKPEYLLVN